MHMLLDLWRFFLDLLERTVHQRDILDFEPEAAVAETLGCVSCHESKSNLFRRG